MNTLFRSDLWIRGSEGLAEVGLRMIFCDSLLLRLVLGYSAFLGALHLFCL